MEKYKHDLDNSSGKNFRDDFYYLCQEDNSLELKKAFIKQNIRKKITKEVIAYGLMGAARHNQLNNALIILELIKKYKEISLDDINFTSAINMSLKKEYHQFCEELFTQSQCFSKKVSSFINRENSMDSGGVFNDMLDDVMNVSIIESKYQKFSNPSLEFFKNNIHDIEFLLKQDVNINYVKDMLQLAVEDNNMIPLIAFVKSKYLNEMLQDKDFIEFISNESHKEIKKELKNLINNALLEKKLDDKLIKKENKEKTNKI